MASQNTITRSTYGLAGQPIATRIVTSPSGPDDGIYFIHTDHLGSVSALTDDGGTLEGSIIRFDPFGYYRPGSSAGDITDRGFTGHKHNDYIKLIYMNARWYDAQIGRFLSADVIVPNYTNPQSFNRYSYTYNNPVNLIDPSGHCAYESFPDGSQQPDYEGDSECWNLLYKLENQWEIDIQDEDLWELEYLLELEKVMNGYAELVGGSGVWKSVLAASAAEAGFDKFQVRGTAPGCGSPTACSGAGYVAFHLSETFRDYRRSPAYRRVFNRPDDPAAARVTIAHEFAHVLLGVISRDYISDYMTLRGWVLTGLPNDPASLGPTQWVASNGATSLYKFPEDPLHHLVVSMSLYVAGNNTWDLVETQDKLTTGPIPPIEWMFIKNIKDYLP